MKGSRSFSLTAVFSILIVSFSASHAAEATFSRTGEVIYQLGKETALRRLDLVTKKITDISVPGLPEGEAVRSLAISNTGLILCLSKSAVYAWDDVKGGDAVVVCRPQDNIDLWDIAYNRSDSTVAVTARFKPDASGSRGEWALFAKFKDENELIRVRCRRVVGISDLAFDREGTLHFSTEGDLWMGRIVREPGDGPYLKAFRYTPLATRETNMGTGDQMGADLVAVTDKSVYSHVRRMGGSGWGHIVRVRKPALPKSNEGDFRMPFELEERLGIYRDQQVTVEILGENGTRSYLCTSPDGKQVYFRASRETPVGNKGHWLIRDGGELEALDVSEPE